MKKWLYNFLENWLFWYIILFGFMLAGLYGVLWFLESEYLWGLLLLLPLIGMVLFMFSVYKYNKEE